MPEHPRIYVVAGSTASYEMWLSGPATAHEKTEFKLLGDFRTIRIMRPMDQIVLLSDWQAREDWRQIYNAMLATGRRGIR